MKTIKAVLIITGITIILIGLSIKFFPEWLAIPGGIIVLLGVAFNSVLDFGGKIKNWIELIEINRIDPIEKELVRNLVLKRRIEKDFSEWLDYFPENRKRNSKMILQAFDGNQYPDSNKSDKYGEYSWFAAHILNLYHNGIEFALSRIESIVITDDDTWDFAENVKDKNFDSISVYRVGRINFSDIVDYDLKGDEHYPFPHFFCKFTHKGLPFEEVYLITVAEIPPLIFEFKNKKSR